MCVCVCEELMQECVLTLCACVCVCGAHAGVCSDVECVCVWSS